jgi:hypothetical protein
MNPDPAPSSGPVDTTFDSLDSPLVMLSDADGSLQVCNPGPMSPAFLLHLMRERVKYYGSPIPEGFVSPPGVDLDALLKQVPWPPAA